MKASFTLFALLLLTAFFSLNAQNLYWSGNAEDVYYASFEDNKTLWYTGDNAGIYLGAVSSTEASLHGLRSAKFYCTDIAAASTKTGNVIAILGGTGDFVDGNIGPIEAGQYTFKAKVHVVEAKPSQLLIFFNESSSGIAGAGSTSLFISLDDVPVGGDATTADGWHEISGVVTLPAYTAMKTGVRTRPQDYSGTGVSTMYVDNLELIKGVSTDVISLSDQDYAVYPNPATEFVTIEAPENTTVEICNVAGSVVKSYIATNAKETLAIHDLAAGLYIVKIESEGAVATEKLLIK